MVYSNILAKFPEIMHAFSDRTDGNMSVKKSETVDEKHDALEHRRVFLEKLGISVNRLVLTRQVHGKDVMIVGEEDRGLAAQNESPFTSADGLATQKPNIFLSVFAADCIPVFFYEPKVRIIATAHAGWRGIRDRIISSTIEKIVELGGNTNDIYVWVGPHIKVCHYDLDKQADSYQEKRNAFSTTPGAIVRHNNQQFLDLTTLAVGQLTQQGISRVHTEVSPDCTACNPHKYYSYHEAKGKSEGTMIGVIGLC